MVDYQNTLTEMKDATESFESHPSGFVSQEFLEQDVTDGFDKVKNVTTELTDEANSIIERVQDLVSVKKIDPAEVIETVQDGRKKAESIVKALSTLDDHETSQLEKTKEDLQMMRNYISEIASKFKSGDLSVSNYNIDAVKNIDAYKAITDEVFGEGYADSVALEPLFEKMLNGQDLTPDERSNLYDYLQHVYLDSEKRSEIKTIADSISEEGIGELSDRLNDRVLESKDTLEDEMAMVQAYLYTGGKEPQKVSIDRDTKAKLEAYLLLLKDYHSAITYHSADGRDEISKHVDKLEYKNAVSNISGHFFESTLKTERTESSWNPWSKDPDDRVEGPMNDLYYHESEVDYYTNAKAAGLYQHLESKELINEQANYTSNFITKEILDKLIGSIPQPAGTALNTATKIVEYDSGERKLDSDIKISSAREYANMLSMEFVVSQNHTAPGEAVSSETTAQLHPTQESYEILKRWKRVHGFNSDIPYPEEDHIQTQDWKEIGELLIKINAQFQGTDLTNLYDYITNDSSNSKLSDEELEELANSF